MDDAVKIILILIVLAGIGYAVYRYTRKSGSESVGGYTRPGKPNRDTDLR